MDGQGGHAEQVRGRPLLVSPSVKVSDQELGAFAAFWGLGLLLPYGYAAPTNTWLPLWQTQ